MPYERSDKRPADRRSPVSEADPLPVSISSSHPQFKLRLCCHQTAKYHTRIVINVSGKDTAAISHQSSENSSLFPSVDSFTNCVEKIPYKFQSQVRNIRGRICVLTATNVVGRNRTPIRAITLTAAASEVPFSANLRITIFS